MAAEAAAPDLACAAGPLPAGAAAEFPGSPLEVPAGPAAVLLKLHVLDSTVNRAAGAPEINLLDPARWPISTGGIRRLLHRAS